MNVDLVVRVVMTLVVVAVGIGVYFVDPDAPNQPRWLQGDLGSLVYRPDGTLRRWTKPVLWLWFLVFVVLAWLA